MRENVGRHGLSRATAALIVVTLCVGALHHTDHVLRVDHSGWPFRRDVNPFTFSLLAYPILLFALLGPVRRFWVRWSILLIGTAFTIYAHTLIETPAMQYAMWAHDRSLEAQYAGLHNLLGIRSSGMGTVAVVVAMALNILLVTSTVAMLADGVGRARRV